MKDLSLTPPNDGAGSPKNTPNPDADPVIDSERILGTAASVWIRHQGALYRLMKTKQGKLILTK
jgi:hemin uptake protein HemP